MNQTNYQQHDVQYRHLRENGFQGWGGESFERRMRGWKETVDSLLQSESFPKRGASILELGSGAGDSLMPFAENGYNVTGIEISPTAVKWAYEKFSTKNLQGRFIEGSVVDKFSFSDGNFDAIVDAACLHCIIGDDRAQTLKEVKRVLKTDGFLLVSHMVNNPRKVDADIIFDSVSRVQIRNSVAYRAMPTFEQLIEEISQAGFDVIKRTLRQNPWWDHAELWCKAVS